MPFNCVTTFGVVVGVGNCVGLKTFCRKASVCTLCGFTDFTVGMYVTGYVTGYVDAVVVVVVVVDVDVFGL